MKTSKTTTDYMLQMYVNEPGDRGIFWEKLYSCTAENWKAELRRMRRKAGSARYRVVKYTTTEEIEIVSAKRNNPRVCVY